MLGQASSLWRRRLESAAGRGDEPAAQPVARYAVWRAVLALTLLAAVQAAGAGAAYAASPAAEQQFVDLVNQERAASGRPPLAVHPNLQAVARNWTDTMIAEGRACDASPLRHNPNTTEQHPWGQTRPAENVGCGESVTWLHQALMNSAGHRANIFGDFDHIGVGVSIDGDGTMWVTQNFVKQLDPVPDAGAANPPVGSRGSGGSGDVTTPPSGAGASTHITAPSDNATSAASTSTASTSTTSTSTTGTTAPAAVTSTTVAASAAAGTNDFTVVPAPAGAVDDDSVPNQPLAIRLFSHPLLLRSARWEVAGRFPATLTVPLAAALEPRRIVDSGFDTHGAEQESLADLTAEGLHDSTEDPPAVVEANRSDLHDRYVDRDIGAGKVLRGPHGAAVTGARTLSRTGLSPATHAGEASVAVVLGLGVIRLARRRTGSS